MKTYNFLTSILLILFMYNITKRIVLKKEKIIAIDKLIDNL